MKLAQIHQILENLQDDKQKILKLFKDHNAIPFGTTVDIDDNLYVSFSDGDFNLMYVQGLTELPCSFENFKGNFSINGCKSLITLNGCPEEVEGSFSAGMTAIHSLKHGPKVVGSNYSAKGCLSLVSLEGAPEVINGAFIIRGNKKLTSLKGGPKKILGNTTASSSRPTYDCRECDLHSLEGAPEEVYGSFDCSDNPNLKSFVGGPKRIINGDLHVDDIDHVMVFDGLPKELDGIFWYGGEISKETKIMNLFFVKKLERFSIFSSRSTDREKKYEKLTEIINRHLPKGRAGMIDCQDELIEAGYEDLLE